MRRTVALKLPIVATEGPRSPDRSEGEVMDAEIDRKIATFFEPEFEVVANGLGRQPYRKSVFWQWHLARKDGASCGVCTPRPHTDPEVCLRLLKWLIEQGVITLGKQADLPNGKYFCGSHTQPFEFGEELTESIALAASRLIDQKERT